MAATLLGRAVDLAFALLYLRLLEPAGAGAFQFLVVLTTYFDTLVNFGLNTVVARDVSRAPGLARAALRTVAQVRLGLWLAGLPVVVVVFGPGREAVGLPPEAALAGWLFYLALLPSIGASTATGLLWAAERLEVPALVSVGTTLLKVGLGSLALLGGSGLVGLGAASLVVNGLTAVALLALVLPQVRGGAAAGAPARSPVTAPLPLLRESWPLFVNQLLAGLFFKVDSLLLLPLAGAFQAGAYAAAYKVIDGVLVIPSSFTLALFPRLSRRAEAGGEGLASACRLSLRALLQVAVPLAAGLALLSEPLVGLLGGRAYLPDGAVALALLVAFMPFSFANGLAQYVLIALGRQRFLTGVFLVAFALNLAGNVLLIPRFGYRAAAGMTVLSELLLLVPFSVALGRAGVGLAFTREIRAPLLATVLMAPVVWWVRDAVHPLTAVAAGVLVYPAALWAVGGVDAEQAAVLRLLLPERGGRRAGD